MLLSDAVVADYYAQVIGATNDPNEGGYIFPCNAQLPSFTVTVGGYRAVVPGSYINYAPVRRGSKSNPPRPPARLTIQPILTFRTQCATVESNPTTASTSPSTAMSSSSRNLSSSTARSLFLVLVSRRRLELVCGSGWMGLMMAGFGQKFNTVMIGGDEYNTSVNVKYLIIFLSLREISFHISIPFRKDLIYDEKRPSHQ